MDGGEDDQRKVVLLYYYDISRSISVDYLPSSTEEVAIMVVRSSSSSSGIVRWKKSRFSALFVRQG